MLLTQGHPIKFSRSCIHCRGDYHLLFSLSLIQEMLLCFFACMAQADLKQNHHQVIRVLPEPSFHWRRPRGHPCTTWLRGIDADVQSANIGIHQAWRKASDCAVWRRIIDLARLHWGHITTDEEALCNLFLHPLNLNPRLIHEIKYAAYLTASRHLFAATYNMTFTS